MAANFGPVPMRAATTNPLAARALVSVVYGLLMGSNLGCCEGCDVRCDAVPGHATVLPSRSVRDVCVYTGRGRMATVYGPITAFAWPYFAERYGAKM